MRQSNNPCFQTLLLVWRTRIGELLKDLVIADYVKKLMRNPYRFPMIGQGRSAFENINMLSWTENLPEFLTRKRRAKDVFTKSHLKSSLRTQTYFRRSFLFPEKKRNDHRKYVCVCVRRLLQKKVSFSTGRGNLLHMVHVLPQCLYVQITAFTTRKDLF